MLKGFLSFVFVTVLFLTSCSKKQTPSEKAIQQTVSGQIYQMDESESMVSWRGSLIENGGIISHFGTVNFKSGQVLIQNGLPQRGEFVVDMKTITDLDLKNNPVRQKQLELFLKGFNFFEVSQYESAFLTITKANRLKEGDFNTHFEGTLTANAITIPVSFDGNVYFSEDTLELFTEPLEIDRHRFGIKFQLPSGKGKIKNEMTLQMVVKAGLQKNGK